MAYFYSITDAYRHYSELFGSEEPVWNQAQLQDWIQTNRTGRYGDLTDEDMDAAFDASLAEDEDDA